MRKVEITDEQIDLIAHMISHEYPNKSIQEVTHLSNKVLKRAIRLAREKHKGLPTGPERTGITHSRDVWQRPGYKEQMSQKYKDAAKPGSPLFETRRANAIKQYARRRQHRERNNS